MLKLGKQTKLRLIVLVCVFLLAGLFTAAYKYKFFFKADEISVSVPIILSPTNNSRFTYVNNPLIQGTATSNSTLDISYNGNTITSVTTNSSGHFYYKPNALENGIHKIKISDKTNNLDSVTNTFSIEYGNDASSILRSQKTQIIENDHPYYGNGANQYDAIVKMMGNPTQVETDFANAEKAGIKMLRVINYALDDMQLPNPTNAPTASILDGGGLISGSYIYRYTCANLSKESFKYDTAETLPSPTTTAINVGDGQKVTLTLNACAKSYRYLIYRRLSTDAVDSESYLGFAEAPAGQDATFVDDGSYRPSGIWPDPTQQPVLQTQARNASATTTLEVGDYVYRYIYKEQRKPVDGRNDKFVAGNSNTFRTQGSPTAQVTVGSGEAVKITIPAQNSPWAAIYRRKASDPEGSEKYIAMPRNINGVISYVDEGIATTTATVPTSNSTAIEGLSQSNQTHNNPRTAWPTGQSKAYMTGFENWNEDALVAADKVMALAQKYNIRIMFTFLDQHDNNTGGVREIARNCAASSSGFFTNTCSKDMNKKIVDKFLNRTNTMTGKKYKDDPAIFAWEFINEPFETGSGGNFRAWLREMGSYVKNIDPNHMLSSGDDGSVWLTHNHEGAYNGNNNHDFVMSGIVDSIDLLTWHGYPESNGFVFNHGYYGEFTPDPVNDADWIDKYGPVSGPIDVAGAVKQLKLRSHYATLLQKPVVFGEWGVDWTKTSSTNWISGLSDAILNEKPNMDLGQDIVPDPTFQSNLGQNWSGNVNFSLDQATQYNNHSAMKITIQDLSKKTITLNKIAIKPNTSYWYNFAVKNLTSHDLVIRLNYYKADGSSISGGPSSYINSTSEGWRTATRFNSGACEFATPADATQVDISISFNGVVAESAWVGEAHLYELVSPTETTTAFSSTGWWAWPDNAGLGNQSNVYVLAEAASKFEKRMFEKMTPLSENVILNSPSTNLSRSFTYKSKYSITGTKSNETTRLSINGTDVDVPVNATTWTKEVDLPLGVTTVVVYGKDSNGNRSESITVSLTRRKPADANNDNTVDIKDFSSLMSNWNKTDSANIAGFNEDNKVGMPDFSIMMGNWGK